MATEPETTGWSITAEFRINFQTQTFQTWLPPTGVEVCFHAGAEVRTYFVPIFVWAPCSMSALDLFDIMSATRSPPAKRSGKPPLSPSDTPSIIPAGLLSCDKTLKYHCPHTFTQTTEATHLQGQAMALSRRRSPHPRSGRFLKINMQQCQSHFTFWKGDSPLIYE